MKTPVANLVRYKSSAIYFARLRIRGKLFRQRLKTAVISVAKLRLEDFIKVSQEDCPKWSRKFAVKYSASVYNNGEHSKDEAGRGQRKRGKGAQSRQSNHQATHATPGMALAGTGAVWPLRREHRRGRSMMQQGLDDLP